MPTCVVKRCKNNSTTKQKGQGITYHRFPTANQPWRTDWIDIIRNCRGENDWVASKSSVICSIHFDASDLYTTKNGLHRVVPYAVPKRFLFDPLKLKQEQSAEESMASSLLNAHCLRPPKSEYSDPSCTDLALSQPLPISGTVIVDSQKPSSSEASVSLCTASALPQLLIDPLHLKQEQPAEESMVSSLLKVHCLRPPKSEDSDPLCTDFALPQLLIDPLNLKQEQPAEESMASSLLKVHCLRPPKSEDSDPLCTDFALPQPLPINGAVTVDSQQPSSSETSFSLRTDSALPQAPIIIGAQIASLKHTSPCATQSCASLSSAKILQQPPMVTLSAPETSILEEQLLFDTPRKHSKNKIQIIIEKYKRKIKSLNQKVRRLQKRNKSLKSKIKTLQHTK